jgi:hypothetical protein
MRRESTPALPRHLPILDRALAGREPPRRYPERELTRSTALCDARGRLLPDARGWSRFPLVRANLRGHWPRKKRWNFWSFLSRDFVFSLTVADIDFASFCSFFHIDFATGERVEGMDLRRPGHTSMPEEVERTIAWQSRKAHLRIVDEGADLEVRFRGAGAASEPVHADFRVHRPAGHESLNVVVPWTPARFQLNSKHNTLPCNGEVHVGERRYPLRPHECHAVQDWGRGIWPHRACWNWAVATGEVDGELLGINMGDRWTTGTGANENGICHAGRLHKIMEDLDWQYDPSDWMKPWRVRSAITDTLDLTLEPVYEHTSAMRLGPLSSGGTCVWGRWNGVVRIEGREISVRGLPGWAEEFAHRW